MPMFRKKPGVVEARQAIGTDESNRDIIDWTRGSSTPASLHRRRYYEPDGSVLVDDRASLNIDTLEGPQWVTPGDWVIKGIAGEFYVCKPDIFAATYDLCDDVARPVFSAEPFIAPKELNDDGWEIGFDKADLVQGVQTWFACQPPEPTATVGMAAAVFHVSPQFLADALDEVGNPFFFAWPGDDPAARILDTDGL